MASLAPHPVRRRKPRYALGQQVGHGLGWDFMGYHGISWASNRSGPTRQQDLAVGHCRLTTAKLKESLSVRRLREAASLILIRPLNLRPWVGPRERTVCLDGDNDGQSKVAAY